MENFKLILRNDFAKITIEVPPNAEQAARDMIREMKGNPHNTVIELGEMKSFKTGDLEAADNALRGTSPKMFVGYIVTDPKGYAEYKELIAVSEDRDKLLTKLKLLLQVKLDNKSNYDYERYDFEIKEVPIF